MKKEEIDILIQLEALKTERSSMIAANTEREMQGYSLAYDEKVFHDLAEDMRALLVELRKS